MITTKLGGSSVVAENFCNLREICQGQKCIVVSAIGKSWRDDEKTTDLLQKFYYGREDAWQKVCQKFLRAAVVSGVNLDVEKMLFNAKKQAKTLAHCLSLGEELTAKLVAAFLKCPYLEAEKIVRFKNGKFAAKETSCNVRSAFCGLKRGVVGGFYGGSANGRVLFPRGGGDVSGAIFAVGTNSELYQNWTDVDGVCNANPQCVFGAKTIGQLSYDQMYLLAQSGAEVLHPDAVKISRKAGIPIAVGNSKSCKLFSSISFCPSHLPFISVCQKPCRVGTETTVLHNLSSIKASACVLQVAQQLKQTGIMLFKTILNDKTTKFFSSAPIVQCVFDVFSNCKRHEV